MFRGMFMGMMLTVGGVFAADSMADSGARPIVNWDVAVVKSIEATNFVRERFARIMDQVQASRSAPIAPAANNG
jgi:hypothetical protein